MRNFLIIINILLLSFIGFSQEKLSLEQAIQIALNKNSTLRQSTNNIEGYESNIQAAWGNFLPTLGVGASWDWTKSDVEGIGTVIVGGIPIPSVATTSTTRNYQANVSSNWTLFDGLSNFANLSQSENDLQSAQLSLQRLKQDIVFQTMAFYYDIINTKKLLEVNQDDLKWNEKNLETIRERNRLGAATLADLYQQEVSTGSAELQIITTKNQLETDINDLLFYLGLDVFDEYTFLDTFTDEEMEILNTDLLRDFENISELVNQAMNRRLDYKSAQLNLESAMDGVTIAQSGHWPSLTASGIYLWRGDDLSNLDASRTLSAGLTLSFPLFLGWSVSNRVQFAEVDMKNSEIQLNDLERNIKRQIQANFLDLKAAQKALLVSENNVNAAEQNLKIEEEKYSLGSGKLLDVLIANSRYTTALTDLINSQFAYIVLSQQLKYHLGILDYKKYENN
jgi:outer membrane protein